MPRIESLRIFATELARGRILTRIGGMEFKSTASVRDFLADCHGKAPGAKHFLVFTEDRETVLSDIRTLLQGRGADIEGALAP